jgi:hypothetical protein
VRQLCGGFFKSATIKHSAHLRAFMATTTV